MPKNTTPFHSIASNAPNAAIHPFKIDQHGDQRIDPYHWLRDEHWQDVLRDPSRLSPQIRDHLNAENAFYEAATDDLSGLRDQLFEEMRGRIKEDDASVPLPDGPFAYYVRYRDGGDYAIFARTARDGGPETIIFDGDKEAIGAEFFNIGAVTQSPDHRLIAYAIDRLGSEYFDIRVRNIETGKEFPEIVGSTDGHPVWVSGSDAFYYIERDNHQRSKRVKLHRLGSAPANDPIIYEEADDGFFLSIGKSQSGEFIFIHTGNSVSSETWFLRADDTSATTATLIAPRAPDMTYEVDHHGEHFYVRTNADGAIDFKICRTLITRPGRENWQDWLAHQPGSYLLGFTPYRDRLVRIMRRNALPEIIIASYDRREEILIGFDEDAYALGAEAGYEFDTQTLRFTYSSMTTPQQTFDYDMKSGVKRLLKTQEIPSGHDASRYVTERLYAKSHDGAEVPVTILRLKTATPDTKPPLLLYCYGSYGITIPTSFSTSILSVVDRGAVYAIAHIRGGAAKGRQWYLDGKLDKKSNTFHDFIVAAQMLQEKGFGKDRNTVIYGGSAGGLLVGAAVNLRPDLFAGVIGAVPFVDVVNTISDASLPLTPAEWDEWGNPIDDEKAYRTILSYSPYDNIRPGTDYPPILATGGLADYRVTYWEPAKWIARLRSEAKGGPFFLKMNMEAGHGGSAARFESLKERAHDYAFALKIFGLN